jgi:hypothetical protein
MREFKLEIGFIHVFSIVSMQQGAYVCFYWIEIKNKYKLRFIDRLIRVKATFSSWILSSSFQQPTEESHKEAID